MNLLIPYQQGKPTEIGTYIFVDVTGLHYPVEIWKGETQMFAACIENGAELLDNFESPAFYYGPFEPYLQPWGAEPETND